MKLPNGPTTHPLLQLIKWVNDPLGYMEACAEKYGDIFTVRWGKQRTIVMVSNPQGMEKMLTSDALTAPGEANEIVRPLLGDNSLILLSGSQHQQRRKLLMPTFHGERMRNYGQLIGAIAQQVSSKWGTNQPLIMESAMQEITMRVILQAVFGLSEGPRLEQLRERLIERLNIRKTLLGSSLIFFPFLRRNWGSWSPGAQVIEKQKRVDDLIYAEIRDRRANPDPNRTDILNLLLCSHDEAGEGLTDIELRDELMTLLIAGHETTASALSWAFYWIHQIPAIREKLLKELDALPENPDPMEIFRLPYLTAVCQETLRIYPVALTTFTRQVQAPVEIMGRSFEPGVKMIGSIYLTHRREDLYPEPHLFKPERFLERQFSPYEYLPFGGGSRRCIGMALAQYEMKLVLATILSRTELALAETAPVKPKRRGLLLATETGVRMVAVGSHQKAVSGAVAV